MGCSTASALQAHTHARPSAPGGQIQAQLVLALGRRLMETHQEASPGGETHFSLEEGSLSGSWVSAWTHP